MLQIHYTVSASIFIKKGIALKTQISKRQNKQICGDQIAFTGETRLRYLLRAYVNRTT